MLCHPESNRERYFKTTATEGEVFVEHNLEAKYHIGEALFKKLMYCCFELPTDNVESDPFDPVRRFQRKWNQQVESVITPGSGLVVDESMARWLGVGMPGLMVVLRKPTPVGREAHTTADNSTKIIVRVEFYEGKERMKFAEFVTEYGANPATFLRLTKPWHGTGREVTLDSGFASVTAAMAGYDHGLYIVGNVKTAHRDFCKSWLLAQVQKREDRAMATAIVKTRGGNTIELLAAVDMDRKPMALIATSRTTRMGEPRERRFKVIRKTGEYVVRSASLQQLDVHAHYRETFNKVDKNNQQRQGGNSGATGNLEDSWRTHKWYIRDYQMLMGISDTNSFYCVRKWHPSGRQLDFGTWRRKLAYQMLHNPWIQLENIGPADLVALQGTDVIHQLLHLPGRETQHCRYCGKSVRFYCKCVPLEDRDATLIRKRRIRRAGMYVCQKGDCFAKHRAGIAPEKRRQEEAKKRKASKA
ncbi:hypothetical protein CYMTET_42790 [Cymbomonas tetramitiformis]|uniref:PiggyBac transposable element-derived protein domain-containing protein n=1 Tax=Cymbomonas tetramitiformis TaxID=36881 RepID=A0AAE0F2A7_9CHLO|nr:hypothetical protein CYMTET_42790 [Cymbomonas tetramitiformis]